MLIGSDATARLLKVGVMETDDQDYVIHAMTARSTAGAPRRCLEWIGFVVRRDFAARDRVAVG